MNLHHKRMRVDKTLRLDFHKNNDTSDCHTNYKPFYNYNL